MHPDSSVIVKAPIESPLTKIEGKIKKRARWILKQIDFFMEYRPHTTTRHYISGESHLYLGKSYRLKIQKGKKSIAQISGNQIHITYTKSQPYPKETKAHPSPQQIKNRIYKFYKEKAEEIFPQCLDSSWEKFSKFINRKFISIDQKNNINFDKLSDPTKKKEKQYSTKQYTTKPELSIRKMEKRWGTHFQNTIILNVDLIRAPRECIEYVILHELCHLIHNNHNREFYNLLDSILPDWKKIKVKLEKKLA